MANVLKGTSTNITTYDVTNPFQQLYQGEGAPGKLWGIEDFVAVPQTGFATAGNYVKLLRFPTNACVKSLEIFTDLSLIDGGTSSTALILGVGIMFSDSTIDGTPVNYQSLVPTTLGIAGGATTPGTAVAVNGASANLLYGSITAVTSSGAMPSTSPAALSLYFGGEVTFNGTIATYGNALTITETPLVELFNFRDGQGKLVPKLGYFDVFVMATHAYNTQPAQAYNIFGRMSYTVG